MIELFKKIKGYLLALLVVIFFGFIIAIPNARQNTKYDISVNGEVLYTGVKISKHNSKLIEFELDGKDVIIYSTGNVVTIKEQ